MDSDNIVNVYLHHVGKDEISLVVKQLKHLINLGERTMSSINEFSGQLNEAFSKMDQSISGLKEDIQKLNEEIAKFQDSPAKISAEDQASLDKIQEHAKSIASSLDELDQLNPKKSQGGAEAGNAEAGNAEAKASGEAQPAGGEPASPGNGSDGNETSDPA